MFAHFVLQTLGLVGVAAFSTIRVWAIWGKALMPTLSVLLITGFVPAANIVSSHPIHGLLVRAMAIAGDLVVLLLTYIKTIDIWRTAPAASELTGTRPRLSTLLIRNGTVYFLSMLIMNIVNLLLLLVQRTDASTSYKFVQVMNVINANLIARFILDLREAATEDGGRSSLECSTIRFKAQPESVGLELEEVMSACLPVGEETSMWVSGQDDVDAEDT
ncbi:hypothetical protein EIP91_008578 [Steccherinum ochraceum]|uniref:Uncharacterized protein n=1 Tax=Steccherinum ochraceum TaxID=92696 RepID=A0A4R0R894_9APHY|nr:hypothetical protein EIP91_008578 [Steccherinum ochraceum]